MQQVRQACRQVAEKAQWVTIDLERLADYAEGLPLAEALHPQIDPECHYLGHGRQTLAFFLTLAAINFGSGYFADLGLDPQQSGYRRVAASLTERFRRRGPFSADELGLLTRDDCLRLFFPGLRNPAAEELMEHFARALNELGCYLTDHFGGRFPALVEAAEGRAGRLVELLAGMPMFQDVALYRGLQVPFYKRAQLATADLAIAFAGRGWGCFTDLDELTLFADNLVPHVLHQDGVLAYRKELAGRIDAGQLLPAGSDEEIELRACAVHAVELLVDALRRQGHAVNAMGFDQLLWKRGHRPEYRRRPRHRTHTWYY